MGLAKILIVDDEHSILRLSQILLQRKGFDVSVALSVREAKSILASKGIVDIIILDLMMPIESGFDFLKWKLTEPDDMKNIPVIVNTAKNLTDEEAEFLRQNTVNIIQKGADFTEKLVSEVEQTYQAIKAGK